MSDFEKKVSEFQKNLEMLASQARLAAKKIAELSKEKESLKAQIEFLQADNERARAVLSENDKLRKDKIWVQNKIDKLAKKIDAIGL